MEDIKLSPRLQMNVDMAMKCECIADIGCDHAYAAIWLYLNKKAHKVIAMDVNEGPIFRANENVKKYNVESGIDVRLSNGTQKLNKGEADCLMIAGMGGPLMVDILKARIDITKDCKQLILQPQSDIHKVREFIRDNGFIIQEERMVKDEGKFYTSIRAVKKGDGIAGYNTEKNTLFDIYGECLLVNRNPVLKEYLENQKGIFEENAIKAGNKATALMEKIRIIEEGLKYYGM